MSAPSVFNNVCDRLYLLYNSGIRIRIWNDPDGTFHSKVVGTSDKRYERLLRHIDELQPEGKGVIDAQYVDGRVAVQVRVRGSLNQNAFAQRLRNMLQNL